LDTKISDYELRGFVEALVAEVEQTYWDYALAKRQIKILDDSLKLAEQQLYETEEMIKVGRMAETEIAAVNAEIALRRQNLITAKANLTTTGLRLLRLLNPPGPDIWDRELVLLVQPTLPKIELDDVGVHVALALRMRPDLNQARLSLQIDELQIVKTKNGLLPVMDLFITLGKTGYADSFGGSVSDLTDDFYDLSAAIRFEYPFRNRNAEANYGRSLLQRNQEEQAVENLAQLVELDVRTAYVEVNRDKEQITATKVTRESQEESLRVETEKFRVGKSTNFLVAQAQRDLVVSQLAEVQAIANYLKAIVELYRLEGSLLERYGISVPGREPIPTSEEKQG
jgi:outer membrane protein